MWVLYIGAVVGFCCGVVYCNLIDVVSHKYEARHSKHTVRMAPEPISIFEDRLYDTETVATIEAIFDGFEYSKSTGTIIDLEAVTGEQQGEEAATPEEGGLG